jgi:hypothetical protein
MNMDSNKLLQQVMAIFSIFMVFFYIGVGTFLAFFYNKSYIDKPVLVILGTTFIFYGLYRAYRSFIMIRDLFFRDK